MAAANPFDQFDATAAASGNPFDQFDAGAKTKVASAQAPDASSKMSGIGRTLENALTLGGADWLYSKVPGMPSLPTQQAQTEAARQSVPAVVRLPAEIGAYAVGPGKFLGPAGAAIGGAGLGGVAAEGALAGGLSSGFGSNFDPASTAVGTAGGAALGAAAGGLTKGANIALQKTLGKTGTVDPAAAIASTAKDSADAYAALHQRPANPNQISGAISNVMSNLDLSVKTGMSPGLKSTINDIYAAVQTAPEANFGQIDSWQRQINAAAQRERYPTDKVVAGKLDSAFDGLIKQAGAGDLQDAAQAAYQKSVMAQNLANWQSKVNAGTSLGQAPLTEAETYYQNQPDKYKTLVDLYQTNQGGLDPSYTAGHLGSEIGGTAGYALGGFPGHLVGKSAGYYLGKTIGKKLKGNIKSSGQTAAIQATYPGLTGIQPTGAVQPPEILTKAGEQIKNLMLGGMF